VTVLVVKWLRAAVAHPPSPPRVGVHAGKVGVVVRDYRKRQNKPLMDADQRGPVRYWGGAVQDERRDRSGNL